MRAPARLRLEVLARLGAVLALGLAVIAGCSSPKKTMAPNVPPETTIFVQGPVDIVNHVVHLYWFGSDPDGTVSGYEVRFLNPAAPADSQWVPTTRTDSVCTVYAPAGYTAPVFEVRAVDEEGLRDPSPARQTFQFSNQSPSIVLVNRFIATDTTFASATVQWAALDPDGEATRMRVRVWLDGNQANADLVPGSGFTIPSDRFRQGGALLSGPRTVYVQAIDDGGAASRIDSTRWYVRAPVTGTRARLLIIDDVPSTNPTNFTTDTLYQNTAGRNLAAGDFSILRFEFTQPFRSTLDVQQTFELFDAVVWYRGTQTTFSTPLNDYQAGIGHFLDHGGNFYLEGLNLFAGQHATGPLTEDFMRRYLGADFQYAWFDTAIVRDSTNAWGNRNGSVFASSVFQDSLRLGQLPGSGLRALGVRDTNWVAVWAPPGQLSPADPRRFPIGLVAPQSGGGKAVCITFALRAAYPPAGYPTVPRFLAKVFAALGLTGP
jgi:hypothetical protein